MRWSFRILSRPKLAELLAIELMRAADDDTPEYREEIDSKVDEQLQTGALPRVDLNTNKVTVIAQAEVAAGVVKALDPDADLPDDEAEEE